ncbi:MAG: hypothetical protein QF848_15355 [Planctomycetota bacterium]|jgi:hypothetical protein|nr:hypothetical protein [Planctomycetota bacterium]
MKKIAPSTWRVGGEYSTMVESISAAIAVARPTETETIWEEAYSRDPQQGGRLEEVVAAIDIAPLTFVVDVTEWDDTEVVEFSSEVEGFAEGHLTPEVWGRMEYTFSPARRWLVLLVSHSACESRFAELLGGTP